MGLFDRFKKTKSVTNENGLNTIYDEDGKLKEEGYRKNGLQEGEWKTYFDNGSLKGVRNFTKGQKDGVNVRYYENGKIETKTHYKDGLPDGVNQNFYESGQLWSEENYKKGEKEGISIAYFENGNISLEVNFKAGKEDGDNKLYYENGQLKSWNIWSAGEVQSFKEWDEIDYESIKNNLNSVRIRDAIKNNLNVIAIPYLSRNHWGDLDFLSYNKKPFTGIAYDIHPNGELYIEMSYLNGKQDGESRTFYDNGQLDIIGQYKAGKMIGTFQFYHKTGVLFRETNYYDGKGKEVNVQFHSNGHKASEELWEDGILKYKKHFDENGNEKLSFERENLNKLIELIEKSNNTARVELEFKEHYATSSGYVYCICLGIINNSSFVKYLKKFVAEQKNYDSYIDWLAEDREESGMGYWEYYNIEPGVSLGDAEKKFIYDKWLKNERWENEDADTIDMDDYDEEEREDFEMMVEECSIRVFINDTKVACSADTPSSSYACL